MKTKWLFLQRKENYCEIFVDHKYITAQTQTECPAKASTGTRMSVVLVHHLFTKSCSHSSSMSYSPCPCKIKRDKTVVQLNFLLWRNYTAMIISNPEMTQNPKFKRDYTQLYMLEYLIKTLSDAYINISILILSPFISLKTTFFYYYLSYGFCSSKQFFIEFLFNSLL